MKPSFWLLCLLVLGSILLTTDLSWADSGLTMEQAVAIALARNHDVIAAKLSVDASLLDRVQAGLYPNPTLSYALGNLVVGKANPQTDPPIAPPGFFGQTTHALSISDVIDIWAKRNTRIRTADRTVELTKLKVQDALREIVYNVRSAFTEFQREKSERDLSRETRVRYDETVRISRARFSGGDISEAELKKVELEGLRYQNAEVDAEMQLDLARLKLAALLGFTSPAELPGDPSTPDPQHGTLELAPLVERATQQRPDVLAAREAREVSLAALEQARREAFPDLTLSLSYYHSEFLISGDNPNSLGFGLSLPLPIFDHNQANIGRAQLDEKRAENEARRLFAIIHREVAEAVRRTDRGHRLLNVFEGGMLDKADTALRVAEKSYRAGAISLLELLEAQRTYLETRAQYVRAQHEYRQAMVDVMHAISGEVK